MLYELAITPDVFDATTLNSDPVLGVNLIEVLRGACDNGMIANLHEGAWIKHVTERLQDCSPALKDKLKQCLLLIDKRKRLVQRSNANALDPVSDHDWLYVTLKSHQHMPFYGIVLGQALLNAHGTSDPVFINHASVLDSERWRNRRRTVMLTRSEPDYRTYLTPVLRHARKVVLIDPYLRCYAPHSFRIVEICAELLAQRDRSISPGYIYIQAGNPNAWPIATLLHEWKQRLQPLANHYGYRFKVFLWRSRPSNRFHDRFILTDQCGIMSSNSLESFPNTSSTIIWSLLDEDDRDRCFQSFNPFKPRFELLGQREVVAQQ